MPSSIISGSGRLVTQTDLKITDGESLLKVNKKRQGVLEEASPKYPAELMVMVACYGEALKQPIPKERFVANVPKM